ncbi:MAG: hypothetical protein BECKG1743F_GA0114225_105501, partial [Candidatus Kentron sp. G]
MSSNALVYIRVNSEGVKKSPGRSEVVPKRDWKGAKVPKPGSVASYMTRFWCFCNAASRDLGASAEIRRFFHSPSALRPFWLAIKYKSEFYILQFWLSLRRFLQKNIPACCSFAQLGRCNDGYKRAYARHCALNLNKGFKIRHPTRNNLPTLLCLYVRLLCCNDSYIVHYAPVIAHVTARVVSGVASHIQVEETEALHVSRIALMVRGYLRSECVKELL